MQCASLWSLWGMRMTSPPATWLVDSSGGVSRTSEPSYPSAWTNSERSATHSTPISYKPFRSNRALPPEPAKAVRRPRELRTRSKRLALDCCDGRNVRDSRSASSPQLGYRLHGKRVWAYLFTGCRGLRCHKPTSLSCSTPPPTPRPRTHRTNITRTHNSPQTTAAGVCEDIRSSTDGNVGEGATRTL